MQVSDGPREATERIAIVRDHPGVSFKFEANVTGDAPSLPPDVLLRLMCHAVVEQLPTRALRDVWDEVFDVWETHCRPSLPRTERREVPLAVSTKMFDPVEEPPFNLVEE